MAFTFPVAQPPAGSSLVLYLGAVWSDGSTYQTQGTALAPPAVCGQITGNGRDNGQWGNFADIRFTQQCVLGGDGPQIRWVSRVTAELAVGTPYDFQPGDAWMDYWVSNGGRAEYQRATQGRFDLGSRT